MPDSQISVTVPALIMNPEKARGHRLLNLDKMLEAKCIGARQFVISMPDRQWRFKAASDKEAAVWVACIKEVQSESGCMHCLTNCTIPPSLLTAECVNN